MDTAFAAKINVWHDFYLLVGTAAATLVGLLFIALTLNSDVVRRNELGTARTLARQSFACFINLLTVAGVMLIPDQSPSGVGIPLACIGGFSLLFTVRSMIARRRRADGGNLGAVLRHTALMILGMGALIAVGIGIWTGHAGGLTWLTVAVLTLLSGASHNAWTLLIGPREAIPETDTPQNRPRADLV